MSTKVKPAINRKTAERLLRQVVKGRENHVDPASGYDSRTSCKYLTRSGKPSCIVGNVLVAAGVEIPFGPRSKFNTEGIDSIYEEFPNLLTPGALKVLEHAQAMQDRGTSWGEVAREVLSHKKGRI